MKVFLEYLVLKQDPNLRVKTKSNINIQIQIKHRLALKVMKSYFIKEKWYKNVENTKYNVDVGS